MMFCWNFCASGYYVALPLCLQWIEELGNMGEGTAMREGKEGFLLEVGLDRIFFVGILHL